MSRSVPGFWRMSVDAHFGQRFRPSFSFFAAVSIATGSGFRISRRTTGGRLYGSKPNSPGFGGTSWGDPGPEYFEFDMAVEWLEPERLGLGRVVIRLRDEAEIQHLFRLLELRDRIVGGGCGRLLQSAHAHHAA